MGDVIIKINEMVLSFEDGTAFNFNNIAFNKGKITGIIGANGSGKTTLVEGILDLKKLSKADIIIDGKLQKEFFGDLANKHLLGCQLQKFAFSEMIKVSEMVALHKALFIQQSAKVYDALAMGEIANKRIDKLSGGQKQRVNLFMALAHMPKIITLDEPSAALDKTMAERLIELLKHLSHNVGCSILMVTHHPYELDICDEILTISKSTNAFHETRTNFINEIIGAYHAQVYIEDRHDAKAIKTKLETIENVKQVYAQNGHIDIYGRQNIEQAFLELVRDNNIESYSFARTNSTDILTISTQYAG